MCGKKISKRKIKYINKIIVCQECFSRLKNHSRIERTGIIPKKVTWLDDLILRMEKDTPSKQLKRSLN